MNACRMGFFKRLYYSISGFGKYRYFLSQSTGKAVVYLLLIAIVIGIVTLIPAVNEYNNVIDEMNANFDSKVPDFSFSNGKLEVSGNMPIVFDDNGSAVVIDTSPDAEEKILSSYDNVMLITSDKIIQKNYVNKRITSLSSLQGIVITKDSIKQALPLMKPIGIFIFVFAGLFFVCGKFISAFIVSLIGLIFNSAFRTGLSYRSIFKISVYSLTLPLIICTILSLLPVHVPLISLIFYIIASVYVYGAISTIKKELDGISSNAV